MSLVAANTLTSSTLYAVSDRLSFLHINIYLLYVACVFTISFGIYCLCLLRMEH